MREISRKCQCKSRCAPDTWPLAKMSGSGCSSAGHWLWFSQLRDTLRTHAQSREGSGREPSAPSAPKGRRTATRDPQHLPCSGQFRPMSPGQPGHTGPVCSWPGRPGHRPHPAFASQGLWAEIPGAGVCAGGRGGGALRIISNNFSPIFLCSNTHRTGTPENQLPPEQTDTPAPKGAPAPTDALLPPSFTPCVDPGTLVFSFSRRLPTSL